MKTIDSQDTTESWVSILQFVGIIIALLGLCSIWLGWPDGVHSDIRGVNKSAFLRGGVLDVLVGLGTILRYRTVSLILCAMSVFMIISGMANEPPTSSTDVLVMAVTFVILAIPLVATRKAWPVLK